MKTITSVCRRQLFLLASFLVLNAPLKAATLTKSVYLTLPWGKAEGQVGHSTPGKGEDDEGEWAGPTSFSVNAQGDIAIIDMVNQRLQVLSRSGKVREILPFQSPIAWIDDVAVSRTRRWFIIGESKSSARNENALWRFATGEPPKKVMNLTSLGLQSPLELELGQDEDVLVQDNHGFATYHLDRTGHILDQQSNDDRLLFLASEGTYKFASEDGTISIVSSKGRKLAAYPDTERTFSVIGLLPSQALLVMFKTPEEKHFVLEGLSQSGEKVFSIPIQDQDTTSLIFPTRIAGLRNVRVGTDGAIYAAGRLEDEAFRIYRFEIVP